MMDYIMKKNFVSILYIVWYVDDICCGECEVVDVLGFIFYELMFCVGEVVFQVCCLVYFDVCYWLVLCGYGNNGGDGYVVVWLVIVVGIEVMLLVQESDKLLLEEVVLVCEVWLNVGGEIYVLNIVWFESVDLIVDVLFGIGLQ